VYPCIKDHIRPKVSSHIADICYDWKLIKALKTSHIYTISAVFAGSGIREGFGKFPAILRMARIRNQGYPGALMVEYARTLKNDFFGEFCAIVLPI
jgi:hypothetical protein